MIEPKSVEAGIIYQVEPIGRSNNSAELGRKQDPYVIRATERAKTKIRDRIFHLNGGHVN